MQKSAGILKALQQSIVSGEKTITGVTQETLDNIEKGKEINAIITSDADRVLGQARTQESRLKSGEELALHGIPILVKDNIDTSDFHTSGATPALADHLPTQDAGVIQRLKQAGAVIVGKANMHELAFGITSNNGWSGPVRNPWNTQLISGGSSGGSAAAVAAGIVPVSLGSDTGGSNRIPAWAKRSRCS